MKKFITSEWIGVTGCYAFFQNERCLYIGKALCIASRIRKHLRSEWIKSCSEVRVFDFGKQMEGMDYLNANAFLVMKEALLIAQLEPSLNVKRPCPFKTLWNYSSNDKLRTATNKIWEQVNANAPRLFPVTTKTNTK